MNRKKYVYVGNSRKYRNVKKPNPYAHKTRRYYWVYDADSILHELVFWNKEPYNPRIVTIPTKYEGLEEVIFCL
jgi:hypothetical protein